MTWNATRAVMALGALLGILSTPGCTGSEVLAPSTGNVILNVAADPPAIGRYETVRIDVTQIGVRPQDPLADAALGVEPLALVTSATSINVAQPVDALLGSVPLSDGAYRVTVVKVAAFRLTDQNPNPSGSCLESIIRCSGTTSTACESDLDCGQGQTCVNTIPTQEVSVPIARTINVTDPRFQFVVSAGGQGSLRMVIDGPALVSLLEAAFTCSSTTFCGSASNVPPPCLSAYQEPTEAQFLAALCFEGSGSTVQCPLP